jgi:predicted transcriptional regulator of viral defense system
VKYLDAIFDRNTTWILWNDRSQDLQSIHHSLLTIKKKAISRQHSKITHEGDLKLSARMQMISVFFSGPSEYLKMEPTGCHETSLLNDHSTLRNIQEECVSHLHKAIINL